MGAIDKLETLAAAAQFDVCGYSGASHHSNPATSFIHRAALPNGESVCLLKVLMTNVCVNDCAYCVNQVGRDVPRRSFLPDELARLFVELHAKRLVQGLFLSSGIGHNASRTMASMIDTVEILRHRYEFKGYVHLKILPGASFDCVEAACKLANRVSVNMEAPTTQHLAKLSRRKDLHTDIVERMRWVKQLIDSSDGLAPSGQTTQFVVGAAGEADRDILRAVATLYGEVGLRRAYFSAFRPITDSRLEAARPTPPLREHRLYQADWLLRVYHFQPQEVELALGESGNLPLSKDPKLAAAQRQPWLFPMDVNRANYDDLLRVPGIGPTSARRIAEARIDHSIVALPQLEKMGVVTKWATPFIWFQGMPAAERQLSFMPELDAATTVEAEPSLAGVIS